VAQLKSASLAKPKEFACSLLGTSFTSNLVWELGMGICTYQSEM
jgi:hypothetical protein